MSAGGAAFVFAALVFTAFVRLARIPNFRGFPADGKHHARDGGMSLNEIYRKLQLEQIWFPGLQVF